MVLNDLPFKGKWADSARRCGADHATARFDVGQSNRRSSIWPRSFRTGSNKRYPDLAIEHFHHAGKSSGVVDGAAAVLVTNADYGRRHGLEPRARIVATANMGGDSTLMLNAPVPAAKKVLAKAGLTPDDIEPWEINEAFAVLAAKL